MKSSIINRVHLEGRIYDFTIAEKVTGEGSKNPGTPYIGGTLDIATDEDCLNVVQVNFTYVTETTAKGNKNATYTALKKIIDDDKTILKVGKDEAMKVKIDSALALNDFYTDRNGEETLVSAKRVNGGFVTIISALDEDEANRNKFECDMLINNVIHVDADPENNIDKDFVRIKGVVFDYKKAILPVEFLVKSEGGIKYFESLDVSPQNLVFTKVWGMIHNETIVTRKEEESAFGEASVKEYKRNVREWIVTGTSKPENMYEIGDAETGITADEIKKLMADREVYLADVKKRQDDYKASKADATPSVATAPASVGGFNF